MTVVRKKMLAAPTPAFGKLIPRRLCPRKAVVSSYWALFFITCSDAFSPCFSLSGWLFELF